MTVKEEIVGDDFVDMSVNISSKMKFFVLNIVMDLYQYDKNYSQQPSTHKREFKFLIRIEQLIDLKNSNSFI